MEGEFLSDYLMGGASGADNVATMSPEQISTWFREYDGAGKLQHDVSGMSGMDLLDCLHFAPEDTNEWLESGGDNDPRLKHLRETLVDSFAEKSGASLVVAKLKLARKVNHHKAVWGATLGLLRRDIKSKDSLRMLARSLLAKIRLRRGGAVGAGSGEYSECRAHADYLRLLLRPSNIHAIISTGDVKSMASSIEVVVELDDNFDSSCEESLGLQGAELVVQSLVALLHACCPLDEDARDTTCASESGRWLGDVCVIVLPVLCRCLSFAKTHTKCVISGLLCKLSWHDDNKIMIYQAADELVPRLLLQWLCDTEIQSAAEHNSYIAQARINMATAIWNLSKKEENGLRLVEPELFDWIYNRLSDETENDTVMRRVISCVSNLAGMRICVSNLTDYIASNPCVSNFLGTLYGILTNSQRRNMHQRVLCTFANLAYLCVSSDFRVERHALLKESLKQFLARFTDSYDILGHFNLESLERRDRQLKFQNVRFEVARFLWCMIRLEICHGASVRQLARYTLELDVLGASAGVVFDNVPRSPLEDYIIVDVIHTLGQGVGVHPGNGSGGSQHAQNEPVRLFAAWLLAHYSALPEDQIQIASHGGFNVISAIVSGRNSLVDQIISGTLGGEDLVWAFLTVKLVSKVLSSLCKSAGNAPLANSVTVLKAIGRLFRFADEGNKQFASLQVMSIPPSFRVDPDYRKKYLVIQDNLWRPIVHNPESRDDGSVFVRYEVPTGKNERMELSKSIALEDLQSREFCVSEGELPHQINVIKEVASALEHLAQHTAVLGQFAQAGILVPFIKLCLKGFISLSACLEALLQIPIIALRRHCDGMTNVWLLLSKAIGGGEGAAEDKSYCRSTQILAVRLLTAIVDGSDDRYVRIADGDRNDAGMGVVGASSPIRDILLHEKLLLRASRLIRSELVRRNAFADHFDCIETRLEYFVLCLCASLAEAIRRNWIVLRGDEHLTARALFMLQEIVNVCAAILANIAEDTEAICGSIEDPNLTSLRVQTTGEWALAESVSRSLMGCDQEEHISMALFRALQSCLSTVISAPHLESEKVSRTQKQLLDTFHLGDGAVLAILCRILRGSPPDRLLHLVLMATSRIFASAQGVAVSQFALQTIVTCAPAFLERTSDTALLDSLTLLHALSTRSDFGKGLGFTLARATRRIVECLGMTGQLRLQAARLVQLLVRDMSVSKTMVFPELDLDWTSTASSHEGSADVEESVFDVKTRSAKGCVPYLVEMLKCGDAVEQDTALCVLRDVASHNNLCREAIKEHGGIPAIVTAARAAGPQGRRAVATLLAELSLNPNQRQVVDRSGGLLVLLGFQRSLDGDERIQAELALRNFSHDTLHIHLALARSSVDTIRLRMLSHTHQTVGLRLLQPSHDLKLREAAKGLADCAVHAASAITIMREGGIALLLGMLNVRDANIQLCALNAIYHLVKHCGYHFSTHFSKDERELTLVKLLEIARPLRDRAAQVIQRHWKRSSVNPINCAGVVTAANAWELIALSARCLEVLASQSVSASDHMSREGLFYSMLAQLSGSDGALLGLIRRSVPHETQTFALNILLKVQRQSIATLSSVMLNAGGLGLEHVDIKTAKRALLFVARFHWDDDTRGEADALQRRMPDGAGLPHPYDWDESDVLTWITCTGMGELSQGILEYVRLRSLRPLWERKESRTSGWVKTATPGQHLLNLTMHKLTIPPVCASESSAHSFIRMLRLLRLEASATARYLSSGWASQGNAGEDTSNTDLLTAYAKRQHTLTERSRLYRELEEALARTHAGEGMEDTLTLIEGRGRSMGQYACMGRGYVEAVDAFGNLRTLRMLHSGGAAPTHQGDPPAGLRFERCYRDLQTGGVIEVYDGSMYQLALVDEVRRVLGQARNQLRGTTFDIIRGSQAAGKGRCAVLAVMKEATRPAKHVTLELSSRSDEREVGDPEGHMSISLGILEDATGVSHIHILDLVDVTNGQDPRDGRTALMRAIIDGNDDLSLALLERDVDICLSDAEQRNALLHAVILKRDAVAQSILRRYNHLIRTEQGASNDSLNGMLDTRDVTGRAAIHHAVADLEERFDIVQSLLQAKARVGIRDSSGNSPLHLACEYGHVDIVKALIKYNANTGSKNNSAKTPLHIASGKLHIKIVSILLKENQAALVTAEDEEGCTALHYACRALSARESVLSSKEDIDLVKEGEEEVIQVLLQNGADLHNLDRNAQKPLDFSIYYHEQRSEIMGAVKNCLSHQVLSLERTLGSTLRLPLYILSKFGVLRQSSRSLRRQAMLELEYHKTKERAQASRRLFGSERVQQAVQQEWIRGGCRWMAIKLLTLYVLYIAVFSISAIYDSGQNRPHGMQLTRSLREAFAVDSPEFADIAVPDDFWSWAEGPLIDALFSNRSAASWYDGSETVSLSGGGYVEGFGRLLGPVRLTQWRTRDDSCIVWDEFAESVPYCFADYCSSRALALNELCLDPTADLRPFGPDLRFTASFDAHTSTVPGTFGTYGEDGFVQLVPELSQVEAKSALAELKAGMWLDSASRAVAVELGIYSATVHKFTYVRLLAEFPAEGGRPSFLKVFSTFNGFNLFLLGPGGGVEVVVVQDTIAGVLEVALLILVTANLAVALLSLKRSGRYYLLNLFNLTDFLLFGMHMYIVSLQIRQANILRSQDLSSGLPGSYVDLRPLAELEQDERVASSMTLLLAWVKLLQPLQNVFEDLYLLVKLIALMLGKLLKSFGPLLVIIYLAWGLASYTLLSQSVQSHSSVAAALGSQYPQSLGEVSFDGIEGDDMYQGWRYGLVVSFTIVVVIVMLNLLISVLNDLYEDLKRRAKADWCRAQATSIFMQTKKRLRMLPWNTGGRKTKKDGGTYRSSNDGQGQLSLDHPNTVILRRIQLKAAALGRDHFSRGFAEASGENTPDCRKLILAFWHWAAAAQLESQPSWPLLLLNSMLQMLRTGGEPLRLILLREGSIHCILLVLKAANGGRSLVDEERTAADARRVARSSALTIAALLTAAPEGIDVGVSSSATNPADEGRWSWRALMSEWGGYELLESILVLVHRTSISGSGNQARGQPNMLQRLQAGLAQRLASGASQSSLGREALEDDVQTSSDMAKALEVMRSLYLGRRIVHGNMGRGQFSDSLTFERLHAFSSRDATLGGWHGTVGQLSTDIIQENFMHHLEAQFTSFAVSSTPSERVIRGVSTTLRIAQQGPSGVQALLQAGMLSHLLGLIAGSSHTSSTPAGIGGALIIGRSPKKNTRRSRSQQSDIDPETELSILRILRAIAAEASLIPSTDGSPQQQHKKQAPSQLYLDNAPLSEHSREGRSPAWSTLEEISNSGTPACCQPAVEMSQALQMVDVLLSVLARTSTLSAGKIRTGSGGTPSETAAEIILDAVGNLLNMSEIDVQHSEQVLGNAVWQAVTAHSAFIIFRDMAVGVYGLGEKPNMAPLVSRDLSTKGLGERRSSAWRRWSESKVYPGAGGETLPNTPTNF